MIRIINISDAASNAINEKNNGDKDAFNFDHEEFLSQAANSFSRMTGISLVVEEA